MPHFNILTAEDDKRYRGTSVQLYPYLNLIRVVIAATADFFIDYFPATIAGDLPGQLVINGDKSGKGKVAEQYFVGDTNTINTTNIITVDIKSSALLEAGNDVVFSCDGETQNPPFITFPEKTEEIKGIIATTRAGEAILTASFLSRKEAVKYRKELKGVQVCILEHPLGSLRWETAEIKDNGEGGFELIVRFDVETGDSIVHSGNNAIIVTNGKQAKIRNLTCATSIR